MFPRRHVCILIVSQLHTKCLQRAGLLKFHHGGDFGSAKITLLTHSARTSDGRVIRGHSAEVQLFERLYVVCLTFERHLGSHRSRDYVRLVRIDASSRPRFYDSYITVSDRIGGPNQRERFVELRRSRSTALVCGDAINKSR